jgi:DNA-binding LytR/AlgR family response regulator
MIYCMIIDDEPFARKLLQDYCGRLPNLEVVGTYSSGMEALAGLQHQTVDLVFLDIRMPGLSGLELVQSLPQVPKIIFTTAFSEYAVKGFELDAVDYLLKPFDFPRFLKAVNKATARLQETSPPPADEHLFVKEGRHMVKLLLSDIRYIQGQKDYVMFHTTERRVMSLMNLKDLATRLAGHQFLRVHQSYIVNTTHLRRCSTEEVEIGDEILPVSQSYRYILKAYLAKITS